jgi:crotonobetainyl-CoA:carnitine CoA-transferase CaiB-like acyl-CoA transferase
MTGDSERLDLPARRDAEDLPLTGVRVLEVGTTRAAAVAGRLLRLNGASVTKVALDSQYSEAARIYLDSHKDIVSAEPGGRQRGETVLPSSLLAAADVLVTDLESDEFAQIAVPAATLRAAYPSLIVVRCRPTPPTSTGPALSGELSMQAASGFMHMTGDPHREPLGIPFHLGGLSLGIHAAASVGAALLRRELTGEGSDVDLVGQDILASYLRIYGAVSEYYGIPLVRDGSRAPGSGGRYPFGIFPCADGYVAMIGRTQRDWDNIVAMMGHPSWAEKPRYQDMHGIAMDYPDEVDRLLEPWLRQRTRAELLELGRERGIPMAPVRRIDELPDDPQLRQRRFLERVDVGGTPYCAPGLPWRDDHDVMPSTGRRP